MPGRWGNEPVQRAGVGALLPVLLAEQGIAAAPVFEGSGVDPAAMHPGMLIPFDKLLYLLERAAAAAGNPLFGLELGLRFSLDHHGPIGRLMRCAATLDEALGDFVTWQPGYSSGAIVYLMPAGDDFALGYGAYDRASAGSRQLYDAVLGIGTRMLRELTDGHARPVEIQISHREPDDIAAYARLLKGPLRFNQHSTAFIIDRETMHMPLPGADPALREAALAEVQSLVKSAAPGVAARVRHVLRPLIQEDEPSMARIASQLGLHPRTLRRHLLAEGTTFEALRDDVRFAVAREYLELTDLPAGEIAMALAFNSAGNFSEAFRRWSGTTPSKWREAASDHG